MRSVCLVPQRSSVVTAVSVGCRGSSRAAPNQARKRRARRQLRAIALGHRVDDADAPCAVRAVLLIVSDERLVLGPVALRDLQRHTKVGEAVSGAELPERLAEVESDDRNHWQRRDRGETNDVGRPIRPVAGQPDDEIRQCKEGEPGGPPNVGNKCGLRAASHARSAGGSAGGASDAGASAAASTSP